MSYVLRISLVNETENCRFADFDEELESWVLKADGTPNLGQIFRVLQKDYGRCRGGVFRDRKDGSVIRTGWIFESRQRYEDTNEPYLRTAWVELQEVIPEVRKPFVIEEKL